MILRCCWALILPLTASISAADKPFFQDGRTDWKICVATEADPTVAYAAEELRDALKKISGASFEIVSTDQPPAQRAIILGDLTNPGVKAQADKLKLQPGKIETAAVYLLDGRLYLAGNQPRGALYAVYSFLQRELGVRWLWPGVDGEFIPARKAFTLPELHFNHTPAVHYRGFHLCGDWRGVEDFRVWMTRNFINIHRHAASPKEKRMGLYSMWSSHNAFLPAQLFDEHPEYFAEIDGKRYRSGLCVSHPEVDRLVATDMGAYVRKRPYLELLSIFPTDNQDYCRCNRCSRTDVSTAWFEFYNRLTDALKKEFPSLKFATIAYQGYRPVPKCTVRNSEFVEYASYTRCNVHPYGAPGCTPNEDTMREMLQWQATGLPIANYGYEYDIFSRNGRFVPFLTMIDDAIKTGRRLGHVAMITEVGLSPKTGPEVYVNNVQNRLSLYLYARLLWEPEAKMADVVGDWCQTAFGEAAEPMLKYYLAMDRAWTAMPTHAGILGNALRVAPLLLTDAVQTEARASFRAAEERLSKIDNPPTRERAAAAIHREKVLFQQWLELCQVKAAAPRLSLPLLGAPADFAKSSSRPQALMPAGGREKANSTRVSLGWTKDALLVRWNCEDPNPKNVKADAAGRDGNVVGDDAVELILSTGLGGETWHFAVNPRGTRQDYRTSGVGVREDTWNPDWEATAHVGAKAWEAEMVIPFASLGPSPNPNESWQARFVRHNGGRADISPAEFPQRETALLSFSSAARTDRVVLYWSGAPERESKNEDVLIQEFTENGWQFELTTSAEKLLARAEPCDAYWFRHPNGPNKVPAEYWAKHLVPAVQRGALAVFASYWPIPLEQYFGDPSMKARVVSCGKMPLAARITTLLAPGEWLTQPHDLASRLKHRITPAYGFVPAEPSGWTVLAEAAGGNNRTYPYLLARPYGKGLIILAGDAIPVPSAKLLDNLAHYQISTKIGQRENR